MVRLNRENPSTGDKGAISVIQSLVHMGKNTESSQVIWILTFHINTCIFSGGFTTTRVLERSQEYNGVLEPKILKEDNLTVYQTEFENKLLDDTGSYYRDWAATYLRSHSPIEYMQATNRLLVKEIERARTWFHST